MKHAIIGVVAALAFTATAQAAETKVLATGDVLSIENAGNLSTTKLRAALREYGYTGIWQGDHFGHIIKITATGPDGRIYRLKVNMKTHTVTHARRVRHPA